MEEEEEEDDDLGGEPCEQPCLGCLRSALKGKSNGACLVGKNSRCARCSKGKTCKEM